jgi:hypothetical protein
MNSTNGVLMGISLIIGHVQTSSFLYQALNDNSNNSWINLDNQRSYYVVTPVSYKLSHQWQIISFNLLYKYQFVYKQKSSNVWLSTWKECDTIFTGGLINNCWLFILAIIGWSNRKFITACENCTLLPFASQAHQAHFMNNDKIGTVMSPRLIWCRFVWRAGQFERHGCVIRGHCSTLWD